MPHPQITVANHTLRQLATGAPASQARARAGKEGLDAAFAAMARVRGFKARELPATSAPGLDPLERAFELMRAQKVDAAAQIFRLYVSSRDAYRTVVARRWLGDIERMRGRYPRAAHWLASALARAQALGDALEYVRTLNSIGMLCKYVARFADGHRFYRRALRLATRFDPQVPECLAALHHNLGGLEFTRGRWAAAEPHARRAVAIRSRLMGARHPAVAEDRAALAAILDSAGRKREAERLYRQVLPVFERARMPYDVAVNLSNLGCLLDEDGRGKAAVGMYRRAMALQRSLFGDAHPDVAITLNNLGVLYWKSGDRGAGEQALRRSHAMMLRLLGPRHPSTRHCARSLATLRAGGTP